MGSAQFYSMCFYAVLMLFQIFLFCYRGNEVMVHSYDLIDAIFQSNWTALNVKTQKSLLLMMTRAYRPIRMTAGKFVFLSLEAFMSVSNLRIYSKKKYILDTLPYVLIYRVTFK